MVLYNRRSILSAQSVHTCEYLTAPICIIFREQYISGNDNIYTRGSVVETRTFKPSPGFLRYLSMSWIIWTVSGTVLSLPILLIPDPAGRYVLGGIWAVFIFWMICVWMWIGPYYRSFAYRIDNDAVRMKYGVFWKQDTTVPYNKITNVDVTQGPLQRVYGLGTIHVQTAGAGGSSGCKSRNQIEWNR